MQCNINSKKITTMILETKEWDKLLLAYITQQEANLENADALKAELFELIDKGYKRIVLQFDIVTYVDSSFLGAMVSALKYALSKGGDIFLTGLAKDISNMLQLIRMDKVFKIYATPLDVQ